MLERSLLPRGLLEYSGICDHLSWLFYLSYNGACDNALAVKSPMVREVCNKGPERDQPPSGLNPI